MIPNHRPFQRAKLAALLAAFLVFLLPALPAAPLRVVTWDLSPKEAAVATDSQKLPDNVLAETVLTLKALNPDIIILQQIPDAAACDNLLQALRPAEYSVAAVSAFRDEATGAPGRQQVAILSKGRATSPFSDAWKSDTQAAAPGGFASAIVHLNDRTVGVFAVQLADNSSADESARTGAAQQSAREDATRQLVQQLDATRDSAGGVSAFVVAGDFNTTVDDPKLSRELTLARLERAGFASAFAGVPAEKRVTLPGNGKRADLTVDYIFTRDTGRVANVQVPSATATAHRPVAADFDINGPLAAVAAAGAADASPNLASFGQAFVKQIGPENLWWLSGLLVGGLFLVVLGTVLLRRRSSPGSYSGLPATSPPGGGMSMLSPTNAGEIMIMTRSTQTGSSARPGAVAEAMPVVHIHAPSGPLAGTDAAEWRRRAEHAELRADRATEAMRAGLLSQLGQWLKLGVARRLVSDRARLLEAQQAAALKMQVVDERLTRVEQQIQQRTREYELRITELENELVAAREENRELIRAKIAQVRAELERERTRLRQHAQTGA